MTTIITKREWAGLDPKNGWKERPYRMMTNGKTLFAAVTAGLITVDRVERHDDRGYYATDYVFKDAKGVLCAMQAYTGFGLNTWDSFEIHRDAVGIK